MKRHGFTLIELSIVLVIVALIIGGVLVGREMETASRIRNVASDLENYKAAFFTFKARYNAIPGDMPNATSFNLGTNGGGNFAVGIFSGAEAPQVWQHLSRAGIIKGDYTGAFISGPNTWQTGVNLPKSPYPGSGYVIDYSTQGIATTPAGYSGGQTSVSSHVIRLAGVTSAGGLVDQSPGSDKAMPVVDAKLLELKMDDGLPVTGRMHAYPDWADCSSNWGNSWAAASDTLPRPCAIYYQID